MKTMLYLSLIFLLFLNTIVGFNYWRSIEDASLKEAYSFLGNNTSIHQVISTEPDTRLIPYGALKGNNDVDQLIYEYHFDTDDIDIINASINIYLDGNSFCAHTYFTLLYEIENNDEGTTVTVYVRLNRNLSSDDFERLRTARVSFELDYNY